MYKVIEVPDEFNTDYFCPYCGPKVGRVVEGVQHPCGDYDDWLSKPHLIQCGLESGSDKNPYDAFSPTYDVTSYSVDHNGVEYDNGVATGNIWYPGSRNRGPGEMLHRAEYESVEFWSRRIHVWLEGEEK